jgi:hypothetical protein
MSDHAAYNIRRNVKPFLVRVLSPHTLLYHELNQVVNTQYRSARIWNGGIGNGCVPDQRQMVKFSDGFLKVDW